MDRQNSISFLLIWVCFSTIISGQQIDIQDNYSGLLFKDFVDKIEKEKDIIFFYTASEIDSLIIIQEEVPERLSSIMNSTFEGSKYSLFCDDENIIITSNYKIDTSLPYYFYLEDIASIKYNEEDLNVGDYLKEDKNGKKNHKNGIIRIGNPAARNTGKTAMLSGYVKEAETGQPIIGSVVYVENVEKGTITDMYGYFVLTLPKGNHDILIKYVGRKEEHLKIVLNDNGNLNVNLEEELLQLKGVIITSEKEHNVKGLQLGMEKLEISTIKQIPSSMGEVDLLKTALLLPGVQTVGEGASGFNVRGGSTDQNLILIDGAPIFNTSHMFGFFSAFNADVVKDFRLYKSGIPAQYGGRLSSVFDVSVKDGNRKKISGNGGISPITGRFTIEGPVLKEKGSFLMGVRSTYSDWILKRIKRPNIQNSEAAFYDINAKINYDINNHNVLSFSAYYSNDYFKLNSDTAFDYTNMNGRIAWKHTFNKKIYGIFSGIYSKYDYSISSVSNPYYGFDLTYSIDYKELRSDFSWFPHANHTINFGASSILYTLNHSEMKPVGSESIICNVEFDDEYGLESALFISDEIRINDNFSAYAGLRFSGFAELGPKTVYDYNTNAPKSEASRIDTSYFNINKIVKIYGGPELRLNTRYKTGRVSSVKLSYNHNYQYLHMMSNTAAISPTDIWKLSDSYIPPQKGDQIALGFYRNFFNNTIETSIEVYYKYIKDIIEYKPGTEFLLNPDLELDILNGKANAYGLEFMMKKQYGKLNGWFSYTYSSTEIKVDGKFLEEKINNGDYFPADYDKPHDITLVSNYKYSRRLSISNNLTYSTGRPITMPVAKYMFRGRELIHYTQRNEYRIPDYLRWDISLNVDGNLKSKKLAHSSISFSVYNVTGRKNVYSIYFVSDPDENVRGYKLSVFAQPIFTVTYNFKF